MLAKSQRRGSNRRQQLWRPRCCNLPNVLAAKKDECMLLIFLKQDSPFFKKDECMLLTMLCFSRMSKLQASRNQQLLLPSILQSPVHIFADNYRSVPSLYRGWTSCFKYLENAFDPVATYGNNNVRYNVTQGSFTVRIVCHGRCQIMVNPFHVVYLHFLRTYVMYNKFQSPDRNLGTNNVCSD